MQRSRDKASKAYVGIAPVLYSLALHKSAQLNLQHYQTRICMRHHPTKGHGGINYRSVYCFIYRNDANIVSEVDK